jgi:1,5-anhydro-D-fructose reductase (1,5-anhydro-D-mannitol-forming)
MDQLAATVNWGIIGCGDVCEVKSGPAFNKIPNSKLVAVMRRDPEKVKDFAIRHQVPKYYTDAEELILDTDVNAIYIATPPSSHELYTEMALAAGKSVYVEKPVTIHTESLQRMIEAEKKYKGKVTVAHYRRSLPLFIKIKELLQTGELGKPRLVMLKTLQPPVSKIVAQTGGNWRINPSLSGGGLFHDLSPHQLDILYWLFGPPLESDVQAVNQGKLYEAPDLTMIRLRFDHDIYFNGTWSFNVAAEAAADTCEIIGDRGILRFSFFGGNTIELINENGSQMITAEFPENIQLPHIGNVVQYFRGEGFNPCSLEEALVTMQVMDKARL